MTDHDEARQLRPGERIIDGQVRYSADWLNDPTVQVDRLEPPAMLTPDEAEIARRTADIRSYDMARGVRVPKGRRGRR